MTSEVDRFLAEAASGFDQEMERRIDAAVPDAWLQGALAYHHGWADSRWARLPAGHRADGGKKLRPALVLLTAQAVAGRPPSPDLADAPAPVVGFACAVEFAHNFSLIHDDIEDRDRTRRGRPTLWTVCGDAQAINAGDALHTVAHITVAGLEEAGADPRTAADLRKAFGTAILSMTVGQRLDMAFEDEQEVAADQYIEMIGRKTGAIMGCAGFGGARLAFGASGASGADGGDDVIDGYRRFGFELGLAFQIRDDILGIWGQEEETGKSTSGDIRRRKKSYPVLRGVALAGASDRRRLLELYGRGSELDDAEVDDVRAILDTCGAYQDATDRMEAHAATARGALQTVRSGSPASALLGQLVESVTARIK
jgi:geranylgeranyl diphosphate synthase type I